MQYLSQVNQIEGFDKSTSSQALVLSGNQSIDAAVDLILNGSVVGGGQHHDSDEAVARALAEGDGHDNFIEDYSFLTPSKKKGPPPKKKEEMAFDPTQFELYLLQVKEEKSGPSKSGNQSEPKKKRLKLSDSSHDSDQEEDAGDLDFTDGPALGIIERERTSTKCLDTKALVKQVNGIPNSHLKIPLH